MCVISENSSIRTYKYGRGMNKHMENIAYVLDHSLWRIDTNVNLSLDVIW